MQLSLLFPFSPAWVVSRDSNVFVIFFPGVAPVGFAQWVSESDVSVLGIAPVSEWRSYPAGVAVCLRVSLEIASVLSSFPSGAGGSSHPANSLKF